LGRESGLQYVVGVPARVTPAGRVGPCAGAAVGIMAATDNVSMPEARLIFMTNAFSIGGV
jgi:hypothetical protein